MQPLIKVLSTCFLGHETKLKGPIPFNNNKSFKKCIDFLLVMNVIVGLTYVYMLLYLYYIEYRSTLSTTSAFLFNVLKVIHNFNMM